MRRLDGLVMTGLLVIASATQAAPEKPKTLADVLAASKASATWR